MKLKLLFPIMVLAIYSHAQSAKEYFEKGFGELIQQKYTRANIWFDQALELDDKYDMVYYNRGVSKLELEQYTSALSDFQSTIRYTRNDSLKVMAYTSRAYIMRNITKDFREAIAEANQAIELDSMAWGAHYIKGLTLFDLKEYENAILNFDRTLLINPSNFEVYYDRGLSKRKLQLLPEAISDYDQAIELNPDYAKAYNNRGFAKTILEDYQGAIFDFTNAIRLQGDSYAYNNRGYAKLKSGDLPGAKADCEFSIELDETNSWAYHYLGLVYYEMGQREKACELLHQSLKMGKKEVKKDIAEKC